MIASRTLRLCLLISAFLWPFLPVAMGAQVDLPATGQVSCWDVGGSVIPCAGTGGDGEIQAGVAWPTPRFLDLGDYMLDPLTGLTWAADAALLGETPTWDAGLAYANDLELCGETDCRIPNVVEMRKPVRTLAVPEPALPLLLSTGALVLFGARRPLARARRRATSDPGSMEAPDVLSIARRLLLLVAGLALTASPLPGAAQPIATIPGLVSVGEGGDAVEGSVAAGNLLIAHIGPAPLDVLVTLEDLFGATFWLSRGACDREMLPVVGPFELWPWVEDPIVSLGPSATLIQVCGLFDTPDTIGGATVRVSWGPLGSGGLSRGTNFTDVLVTAFNLSIPVFGVDSESDAVDAAPGDGACATAAGECTLRAAITEANALVGQNAVVLPEGSYPLTLAGADEDSAATGDLDVTDALIVLGAGADVTTIDAVGIDRVFDVRDADLRLEGVTVTGGAAPGSNGGGLLVGPGSRLKLRDCAVSGNEATTGGGVFSEGTLDVLRCTVSGNTAFAGGGIAAGEPMVMAGRGLEDSPEVVLTNTTVSGNVADPDEGGGLRWLGPMDPGSLQLEYVTVTASQGGGLAGACPDCIVMRGTIVADQVSGADCVDAGTSQGYSLDSDGSCVLGEATDQPSSDALLGLLEAAGGPTPTHALGAGSPALAALPLEDCTWDHDRLPSTPAEGLATDQRRLARNQSGGCDLGAFEVQPTFCAPAPLAGCIAAGKGSLTIQEKKAGSEKLKASLTKLVAPVAPGDFGDPVGGSTRFDLCVYDAEDALVGELVVSRAGAVCGPKEKPCWKAVSDKGFKYKDPAAAAGGVKKISEKAGAAGKGKLQVQAGNKAKKGRTALPTGIAAALEDASLVTLQAVTSDGACFGAALGTVKKADGVQLKAKFP